MAQRSMRSLRRVARVLKSPMRPRLVVRWRISLPFEVACAGPVPSSLAETMSGLRAMTAVRKGAEVAEPT